MGFLAPFVAYSCLHKLLECLHRSLQYGFAGGSNAPLPLSVPKDFEPAASVPCLSPVTFLAQGRLTSELLRFL